MPGYLSHWWYGVSALAAAVGLWRLRAWGLWALTSWGLAALAAAQVQAFVVAKFKFSLLYPLGGTVLLLTFLVPLWLAARRILRPVAHE